MRKWSLLLGILLALALTLSLVALADDEDESDEVTVAADENYDPALIEWTCPEGFEGQTLNVYNWATYIGANTIRDFERLCGVTVTYDVYDSNESMLARLRQGNPGYDIAFPNDYVIPLMIREGLIEPLDYSKIPNFANIDDRWKGKVFDPNNEFTAAYMWGTAGIAYNVNRVSGPVTSWFDLFNHDGPVAWLADSRTMLSVALNLLGYDPNSVNPDEIFEARDFLLENSQNVVAIAADDGQALLERGEVDMAIEYGGDIYQLIADCECEDFAYVLPEDGAVLDIALMVVLSGGPNPELAHAFIDYILDPYVNAQIANDIAYPTANRAAIESGFIFEELLNDPIVYPDTTQDNLWFLEYIGDNDIFYNDAWDELLILVGR